MPQTSIAGSHLQTAVLVLTVLTHGLPAVLAPADRLTGLPTPVARIALPPIRAQPYCF